MNRDYDKLFQTIERLINKHNQAENCSRCYGLTMPLSSTEIHIIDEIGRSPGIGVKGIAISKGVTEGAISQLVKKLIKKGLVKKQISQESEAKVNLNLTEEGQICFREHMKFHKKDNRRWYEELDKLEDRDYEMLNRLVFHIEKTLL